MNGYGRKVNNSVFSQVFFNILIDASLLGLFSFGMSIRIRSAQVYDFSYFSMFVLGAYLTWGILELTGLNFLFTVLIAITILGITALTIDVIIYRSPLLAGRRLEAMIASLGLLVVVENLLFILAGPDTKIFRIESTKPLQFDSGFGLVFVSGVQLTQLLVSSGLLVFLTIILNKSDWGVRFRAVDSNRNLAFSLGLRPWRLISEAQILCACLAGLSGILFALDRNLVPDMVLRPMLHVTVAIVIGGLGKFLGPVIGAVAVTFAWHVAGIYLGTQWQDASVFVMLIFILLFFPRGLTGKLNTILRET